jgi:hypothetical protein
MINPGYKYKVKLKTKASMDGAICFNASQKSAVLLIFSVEGILISMISNVNAMANTPSQKASNRELGFDSAIFYGLFILSEQ